MKYIFVMKLEKNWRAITFAGTCSVSCYINWTYIALKAWLQRGILSV